MSAPRRYPLLLPIAVACLSTVGCAATLNDLRATHAGFAVELQEVGNKGGRECAPLAYAMAQAEHDFAAVEFAQADVLRATHHMREARKYLDVAKVAAAACGGATTGGAQTITTVDGGTTIAPATPWTGGAATSTVAAPVDSDNDGYTDDVDKCPSKPEDPDGFNDHDGCPDLDNDGDGINDDVDRCPSEPEDLDGTEDTDGCIDPDNDGDGIPDVQDVCPDAPETVNGLDDTDGCPDEALSRVRVERNQIVLVEPIAFIGKSNAFADGAMLVLSELSVLLESRPTMRIRIEAHTDSNGDAATNQTLTVEQSRSVRDYLAAQGVDPSRMEAVGYGATMPIDTNRTPEGRAANQRIEIYIVN